MKNLGRHLFQGLLWLLLSEVLCLILAISFAIMQAAWLQWVSLFAGAAAHILLISNCAQNAAREDAAAPCEHPLCRPALTALVLMLPAALCYLLLAANPESILLLNLFPLAQAPFLQIHRLLIGGAEPFSAVPRIRQLCMMLPPLLTGISYFCAYLPAYREKCADIRNRCGKTPTNDQT